MWNSYSVQKISYNGFLNLLNDSSVWTNVMLQGAYKSLWFQTAYIKDIGGYEILA